MSEQILSNFVLKLSIDTALTKTDGRQSITIDTNLIETDFLDVSSNLNTGKYFPFKKPNNTPLYIYIQNPTTHRQSSSNCHQ